MRTHTYLHTYFIYVSAVFIYLSIYCCCVSKTNFISKAHTVTKVQSAGHLYLRSQLQKKSLHHSSHTRPTNLLGKVIQQGVKAFEAALVDSHPDAPKLTVTTFVEGNPLCWGGCGHMGEA